MNNLIQAIQSIHAMGAPPHKQEEAIHHMMCALAHARHDERSSAAEYLNLAASQTEDECTSNALSNCAANIRAGAHLAGEDKP